MDEFLKPTITSKLYKDDLAKIKEDLDVDTSFFLLYNMDFGCDFANEFNVQIRKFSGIRKTCILYLENLVIFPKKIMFFKTYKQFSLTIYCNSMDQPNYCSIARILC